MACLECGGKLSTSVSNVPFNSRVLGKIFVPGIKVEECTRCGMQLLYPGEAQKITDFVLKKESDRVSQERFCDFVTLNDAASLLGMSKQAISKSQKITCGFIMSADKDGRRYYLRESVSLFKSKGDGRFLLDPINVAAASSFAYSYGLSVPRTINEVTERRMEISGAASSNSIDYTQDRSVA